MLRVFRFNSQNYLELRDDENATGQAVAALFLVALSYAVGFALFIGPFDFYSLLVGVMSQLILSMLAGLIWAGTAFLVSTKLLRGKAKFWQVARPLFFSYTPGLLFVLIAIPVEPVYLAVTVVVFVWMIAGGVVALKNAIGFGYDRSMLAYIVGFLIGILVAGFFNV
jgi:Yip1-like protein